MSATTKKASDVKIGRLSTSLKTSVHMLNNISGVLIGLGAKVDIDEASLAPTILEAEIEFHGNKLKIAHINTSMIRIWSYQDAYDLIDALGFLIIKEPTQAQVNLILVAICRVISDVKLLSRADDKQLYAYTTKDSYVTDEPSLIIGFSEEFQRKEAHKDEEGEVEEVEDGEESGIMGESTSKRGMKTSMAAIKKSKANPVLVIVPKPRPELLTEEEPEKTQEDEKTGSKGARKPESNPLDPELDPDDSNPGENTGYEGQDAEEIDIFSNTWGVTSDSDISDMVDIILPAIKYEGFEPKVLREAFVKNFDDVFDFTKNIIFCFMAYAEVGNTTGKLGIKRKDVKIGSKLSTAIGTIGVKRVAETNEEPTLPRLALAFMPLYLHYRKMAKNMLTPKVPTELAIEYQDVCFIGCKQISGSDQYGKYYKEFSSLIYSKEKGVKTDDEAFVKSLENWRRVSTNGYENDTDIHNQIDSVVRMRICTTASLRFAIRTEYNRVKISIQNS